MICLEEKRRKLLACESCHAKACKPCLLDYYKSQRAPIFIKDGDCQTEALEKIKTIFFTPCPADSTHVWPKFIKIDKSIREKMDDTLLDWLKKEQVFMLAKTQMEVNIFRRKMNTAYKRLPVHMDLKGANHSLGAMKKIHDELKVATNEVEKLSLMFEELSMRYKTDSPCFSVKCDGSLDVDNTCLVCKVVFCATCRQPKDDREHTCPASEVSSVEAIKTDTMPCPKCGIPIYKIEGCNDMFCVKCFTPFNFSTGVIISGQFHNPHHEHITRVDSDWLRDVEWIGFAKQCKLIYASFKNMQVFESHLQCFRASVIRQIESELQKGEDNVYVPNDPFYSDARRAFIDLCVEGEKVMLCLEKVNKELCESEGMFEPERFLCSVVFRKLKFSGRKRLCRPQILSLKVSKSRKRGIPKLMLLRQLGNFWRQC
jgi:hypothetical protein